MPWYFSHYTQEYLNRNFQAQWIDRGGATAWPPRLPDLSQSDFFLGGIPERHGVQDIRYLC